MNPRTTLSAGALVLTALLTACGGSSDGGSAAPEEVDLGAIQAESGVPTECLDAFPAAMTEPDLADVSLLPAEWPALPSGDTLCQTSSTLDGSVETVDFATEETPAAVLDAYEAALSSFEVERVDQGLGPQLVGTVSGVAFEITPREGAYTVLLSAS